MTVLRSTLTPVSKLPVVLGFRTAGPRVAADS
jgi:hypothetical protein